jgi:nicotinamide-nucleotide amidase
MIAAADLLHAARTRELMLVTAESCTGGLIAAALTDVPGSSDVVWGGYVTYANAAKLALGVDETLLALHGAVSEPVARAMAEAALSASGADVSVAVTGVAGPGGGSEEKPVGLVHFASARRGGPTVAHVERYGDLGRAEVRARSVQTALDLLYAAVTGL